jgi:hypothetical protein
MQPYREYRQRSPSIVWPLSDVVDPAYFVSYDWSADEARRNYIVIHLVITND